MFIFYLLFDYGSVDESKNEGFNWGYDPVNYNVPEGSYSTDPFNGEVRIMEFKRWFKPFTKARTFCGYGCCL